MYKLIPVSCVCSCRRFVCHPLVTSRHPTSGGANYQHHATLVLIHEHQPRQVDFLRGWRCASVRTPYFGFRFDHLQTQLRPQLSSCQAYLTTMILLESAHRLYRYRYLFSGTPCQSSWTLVWGANSASKVKCQGQHHKTYQLLSVRSFLLSSQNCLKHAIRLQGELQKRSCRLLRNAVQKHADKALEQWLGQLVRELLEDEHRCAQKL